MPSVKNFEIKLPQFEGPFDLLLFFIERDELDIMNIPISAITSDFLDYLHHAEAMNMEIASEFILVASTLMRIKAKMLLPRYDKNAEGNEADPRQDLAQKLFEYRQYKEASETLRQKEAGMLQVFERGNIKEDVSEIALIADGSNYSSGLNELTLFRLLMTFEKVMEKHRKSENNLRHVVMQPPYSIEEEKSRISALIKTKSRIGFSEIFEICKNRIHAVYIFLSLLDLIQSRFVSIFLGVGSNSFFITEHNNAPYIN